MKAIMVLFDTLNRLHLPPYGATDVHAPNFRRLAERACTFDRCYAGSLPCMPARRELHTGRYNFLHRLWGPLEPFDDSMPQMLRRQGKVYTHLVTDHWQYWVDGGATYHYRYDSFDFVRGSAGDPCIGQVADPVMPAMIGQQNVLTRRYWLNRQSQPRDEDRSLARSFASGLDFIARNAVEDDWFLQLECFDPHEPFFTHDHWKALYPDDYDGPHFDWPNYGAVKESAAAVEHLRNRYKAALTMCDHYLGRLLDMMDSLKMWDDTMLIVCTDHGFLLGEHGDWAKCWTYFYDEVAHTPLFIHDPRCAAADGARRDSLVQFMDLPATLLDFFGVPLPEHMEGRPLRGVIERDEPVREAGLFGLHGGQVAITDGRYVYYRNPDPEVPIYDYTLMPTHATQLFGVDELSRAELCDGFSFTKGAKLLRIPARTRQRVSAMETRLYDLQADPRQERPLRDADVEDRLCRQMAALMAANEAPEEQFQRLGLERPVPVS